MTARIMPTRPVTPNDRLKAAVGRMHALVSDPHPGLITWTCMWWGAVGKFFEALGVKEGTPPDEVKRALVDAGLMGGPETSVVVAPADQPMQQMYESYNDWKAGRITWDEWIAEVEALLPGLAREAGVGPKGDDHVRGDGS